MKSYLFFLLLFSIVKAHGQGSVKIKPGVAFKAKNGVQVVFNNMNLQNDGIINQAANDATFVIRGSTNDTIRGSAVMKVDRLRIAKDGNQLVTLEQNLNIGTEVLFDGGIFDVTSYQLDLGSTASLKNETESSRAFSSSTGVIQAVRTLVNPDGANPGNLGVILTSTADLGITLIKRGHIAQNVAGAPSINRYYDVLPANNNSLRATVRLNYLNVETNGLHKEHLTQWKSAFNDQWDLNGADVKDTIQKFVEKANNNKLYRMTLATAISPSIICPGNISVIATATNCSETVSFTGTNAATATGYPTPTISYRIGKNIIPTTSDFIVGTTVVTAVASDGAEEVSCDFTVTIIDNTSPVITFCPPSSTFCYNSSNTYTVPLLTASDICGYIVTYSITGATNRTGLGTNASGLFNVGTSTIFWTVTDNNGNSSNCTTSINVVTKGRCTKVSPVSNAVSVEVSIVNESELHRLDIKAIPNPSQHYFSIITRSNNDEPLSVKVMDVLGRLVENRQNISANTTFTIGENYRPGIYFMEVMQGKERQILRLVKIAD